MESFDKSDVYFNIDLCSRKFCLRIIGEKIFNYRVKLDAMKKKLSLSR